MLNDLLKNISQNNPYGIQARGMGKFGLAPTTPTIDRMANWDAQDAVRRANEALQFYDIQEIPGVISPDNPYYDPLAGAVGQGRVPTNLYQSALGEQKRMGSSQAVADLVKQFQGMITPETPPHIQALINATEQYPDPLGETIDLIFKHFGDVHAAQQNQQRQETIYGLARELGLNETTAQLLFVPELSNIAIEEIKKQFPDQESQLKIQKLQAEIEKIKADTMLRQTESLAKIDGDDKFIKELRARYQSYLNELKTSGKPVNPLSEPEFAMEQGKEVYDRYNKILNPARGEAAGVSSGRVIQEVENITRQYGDDLYSSILGSINDQNVSDEAIMRLIEMYNENRGGLFKPKRTLEWFLERHRKEKRR